MKTYFIIGIAFGILTLFSACNGRGNTHSAPIQFNQKSIRGDVTELDPQATVIFQDKNDNFWFGSKNNGVYRYDGENLVLFTSNDGLSSYRILSVQEDDFGNLYFDTPEGVLKYDGQKFITLTVVENTESENEWKSEKGDLWFRMGWDKSGPYRFDGKNLYHLKLPKNEMEDEFYEKNPNTSYNPYGIYSLFKDSKDNIWLGTSNLGVYLFDGKELSWMYENQLTETPEGGDFGIRSIAEDKDGNYWICNTKYKYTLLPKDIEGNGVKSMNIRRQTGIENKGQEVLYFLLMETDNNGDLLMLTYENGVWRNNGKELCQFFIKDGERDISPTSIYKDKYGILWLGTEKYGIYTFNGTTFEKFKIK